MFAVLLFALGQTRHKQWSQAKVLLGLRHWRGVPARATVDLWFRQPGAERLHSMVQYRRQWLCPAAADDRHAAGFASILSAVARLHNASQLGKISFLSIGTLLFTTLIAALVGVLVTNLSGLSAEGLVQAARKPGRLECDLEQLCQVPLI